MSDPVAPWAPEPVPAEPPPPPAVAPSRARSRRGLTVALVLSLIAVAGLAVPLTMLALARSSWEAQNAQLRERVETLTDEASVLNARVAELEEASAQLATLKEEYSAAVNQGAQGTESVVELESIVDGYQECVTAQTEHFEVLRHADRYVASSIVESEASILDFCTEVSAAYVEFRARND